MIVELLAICRRLVDPDAQPLALHAGHNGTAVLRAGTSAGDVIVKVHRSPERHRQEVHAYEHWTAALGHHGPKLIAVSHDPAGIIVTCLAGVPLSEATLDPDTRTAAYQQAGQLLRAFHDAAPPRSDVDMTAWLAERGEYWLERGRGLISSVQRAEVRAHLRDLVALGPILAVPCHLDVMPRNILVDPVGQAALVDFEHARYDLAARDLVRLATRVWPEQPGAREAFLAGYGPMADADAAVIQHCGPLDRLTARVRTLIN